ncbi:MAG: DUF6331 family protein [Chloroflexota bacterium]
MKDTPITLQLGHRLQPLIQACEKACIAECCGIDAFDFSPLHIASHLSAYTGRIRDIDLEEIEDELDQLRVQTSKINFSNYGFVYYIEEMHQYFTKADLDRFVRSLSANLKLSPQVLNYANEILEKDNK